mgnify:CR=1 FL=1
MVAWSMTDQPERAPAPPATGDEHDALAVSKRSALLEGFREVDRLRVMGASTAGLAHELRSPLSTMSMQVQVTLMRKDLDDKMREDLQNILNAIKRMTDMVSTAVEFAEGSKLPRAVSVPDLFERIHPFFKIRTRHANIPFEVEVPSDLPSIMGVEIELAQALINVVDNAVGAVERKGEGAVRVRARRAGERVAIDVEDDGDGFDAEFVTMAFAEFASGRSGGFGLGLPLARSIVEAAGGSIEITSMGTPTCVTLELPAAP